jgi:hypothetical protein
VQQDYYRQSIGTLPHIPGRKFIEKSFRTPNKWSGAAGTAYAPLSALLQAAGYTETVVPTTSVTYTPANVKASSSYFGPGKSISTELWLESASGGMSIKGKGGLVSQASLKAVAGKLSEWTFNIRALFNGNAADASLPTEDLGTVLPAIFENATITVDGVSLCIENLDFVIENNIAANVCATSDDGMKGFQITGRQVRIEFDPELLGVATHPALAKLRDGSLMAFVATWTIESNGSTPQKMTIGGDIQYTGMRPADRDGIRTVQMTAQFRNDSESIKFEAA